MFSAMRKLAILGISCWSGFLLMSLELLSGRILAPTFGSSIYVLGAVITVFMVALSVGYLIGGRMSMSSPRLYILCGLHLLSGLLILPILAFENAVLEAIFIYTQDPRLGSLLSSMIMFFLPAAPWRHTPCDCWLTIQPLPAFTQDYNTSSRRPAARRAHC
jgi:hypothetical protein